MTQSRHPAPIDMVRAHFPTQYRQYIVPAGDSGDYHLAVPGCAPIEVRYTRLYEAQASVTCIVPDVGMHDGAAVWIWSAGSARYQITAGMAAEQVRDMLALAAERMQEYTAAEQNAILARTGD